MAEKDSFEHRRIEDALRESERKYQELMKFSPAGIYEVDLRTQRFLSVNDAMCRLSGYNREELLAMNILDLLSDDSKNAFRQRQGRWQNGECPESFVEFKVVRKDGQVIDALLNSTFLYDGNGIPCGATVVAQDITERKRAEDALRESEDRFKALSEASPMGVSVGSADGRILYTNPSYDAILGYEPGELIGRASPDVYWNPKDRSLWSPTMSVEDLAQNREFEVRFKKKDGTPVWVSMHVSPISFGGRKAAMGVIQDISERRRAEEERRDSEERQSYLLRLSDALRPLSDAQAIQDTAARLIAEHLGVSHASYTETSGEYNVVKSETLQDSMKSLVGAYKLSDYSAAIDILRSGRNLVVSDASVCSILPAEQRARWKALQIRACISIPLVKDGKLITTMAVRHSEPREWTKTEIELVRETAERTWSAVMRARAEEALRESERVHAFQSAILESVRDPMWATDSGFRIIYWNDAAAATFGWTAAKP